MKPTSTQYDCHALLGLCVNGTACTPGKTMRRSFFLLFLILSILFLITCKKSDQQNTEVAGSTSDGTAETTTAMLPPLRIVSLSPALTDMLIDLGLEKSIVGRDAWDERLSASIPRVGDLSNLDLEQIILLQPTHLILQQGNRSIPESLNITAQKQHWTIINLHIDSLNDLFNALDQLARDMVNANANAQQNARVISNKHALIDRFNAAVAPLPPDTLAATGKILILYSINPPAAFGPGSYLSDLITKMGITNALDTGGAWQNLDAETILRADPQTILLIKAGPVENTGYSADLRELATLPLRAVRNHQTIIISQPQALLPGTSIIKLAEQIRDTLINMNDQSEQADTKKDPSH